MIENKKSKLNEKKVEFIVITMLIVVFVITLLLGNYFHNKTKFEITELLKIEDVAMINQDYIMLINESGE